MSLAVLAVFSALLLLMIFRPWKSEPVAQAVQTRPGEASGQSMPAQEVKGTERPAAEVVEPPVPADEPLALEPAAKQSPVPSGWATLDVSYKNRLRSAFLTIWIDGEKTWSQRVTAPKGLLKRASGTGVRANIMVPEGGHVIEVRIDGSEGKVRAAKRIEANFEEGQTRRLGVSLIPPNLLKVSWKD